MKPKGPKRKLVMTFHHKETGARHGPIIVETGSQRRIADSHQAYVKAAQVVSPRLPNIAPRISESNIGTTVGFHGVKQNQWNKIFGKKKK
jgi:hypothetical protein